MKFYVDLQTSTHTTAATLTTAEQKMRKPLNARNADLLYAWDTNPNDDSGNFTVDIPHLYAEDIKDGLTIRLRLTTSCSNIKNTLTINGLTSNLIYFKYNTPLTNQLNQYADIILTYHANKTITDRGSTFIINGTSDNEQTIGSVNYGTEGWMLDSSYSDGDHYDRLLNQYEARYANSTYDIFPYTLCMIDNAGKLHSIVTTGTTNTNKTVDTTPFRIDRVIYYAGRSKLTKATGLTTSALYEDAPVGDPAYTFNSTLPPYCDIYLVGDLDVNGYFILDNTSTTSYYKFVSNNTAVPADTFVKGKYYLYIGASRDAANKFQLLASHQFFYCPNTNALVATSPLARKALNLTNIYYGTCETVGSTATKVVVCPDFDSLTTGKIIWVTFTNTNSAAVSGIKLDVNGTGAKTIQYISNNGKSLANLPATDSIQANFTYPFIYNGTYWIQLINTNSTYYYTSIYCTTAAATANKVGSISSYHELTAGKYFQVWIYYTNSYVGAITLNISGKGAKPIYINGEPSSNTNYTLPRGVYIVYDDGEHYHFRTDGKLPGYDQVENTALSTWAGSSNITTVGTLAAGSIPWSLLTDIPDASTAVKGVIKIGTSASTAAAGNHNHDSRYLKLDGSNNMTSDINIIMGDTDKAINFWYNTNKTAGASWRIAALRTGSSDTNYFTIQSGTSSTSATTWNNVIRIEQNTYDMQLAGNVYPAVTNSKTLGTSDYKWKDIYATTLHGALDWNEITNAPTTLSGYGITDAASSTHTHPISLASSSGTSSLSLSVNTKYQLTAGGESYIFKTPASVTSITPGAGLVNGSDTQTAITSTGTIKIKDGGVTNAMLVNSKVTIAGNDISLGGSLTAETLRTSLGLSSALHFIGIATVAITDGSTTDPEITDYSTKTAGDVIIDADSAYEYIWSGSAWERLGPDGSYKVVQTAVTDPSASGTSTSFIKTITQNTQGVITATKANLPTASDSVAGITKVGASGGAAAYSHSHGNISNAGKIGSGNNLVVTSSGTISAGATISSTVSSQTQSTKFLREDGTWAAPSYTTNTNTDTLVKQSVIATSENRKLLTTTTASPTSGTAMEAYYSANIYANASTNRISAVQQALNISGTDKAYLAFNSSDNAIDFIFI